MEKWRSFIPSEILFVRGTENSHLIVGSSNLSASALTRGVEWNLIAPTSVDNEIFEEAVEKFHQYFYAEQTIPINRETLEEYKQLHKNANIQWPISPVWSEVEEVEMTVGPAKPQEIEEAPAPFFHQYLTEKDYRLRSDFSDEQGKRLREYNEKAISDLVALMPMTKWSGSAKNDLVIFEEKIFKLNLNINETGAQILYSWSREIAEYRLHTYFERKVISIN